MTNDQLNYEEMQNFLNQTEVPINAAEGQHNNNNNDGQQQQATSTSNGGNTNPYVVDLRVLEAALESDWPTVRKLLPSARDMELADQDGWSVLHFACREGVDDVVKVRVDPRRSD
jgi:catalase